MKKTRNKNLPPLFLEMILERIIEFIYLGTLGDLEEEYQNIHRKKGKIKADFWYFSQVMIVLIVYIKELIYGCGPMITNYLTVFFRNIKRNKIHSSKVIFSPDIKY